jgi:hypothetical protein
METSLTALCEQISLWIDDGATLPTIEDDLIEPTMLSEDERAALWLYAWSYAHRQRQSPIPVRVLA